MDQPEAEIRTDGGAYIGGDVSTGGGPFAGRDQFFVSIYGTDLRAGAERYRRFVREERGPFRPDIPYEFADEGRFGGRETETSSVVQRLAGQQTVVLYGPAAVGKTSLLLAGVVPALTRQGAIVFEQRDYARGLQPLYGQVMGQLAAADLPLNQDLPLARQIKILAEGMEQGIVLLLDQFERFFLPDVPAEVQAGLRQILTQAVTQVEPRYLRILISIRDDLQSELDRYLGETLPELRRQPLHLQPLTQAEAERAIARALNPAAGAEGVGEPVRVNFSDDVVSARLLGDLDDLTPGPEERIWPADLQIVCDRLYQAALEKGQTYINTDLYLEMSAQKGAEQILNVHFDGLLTRIPAASRPLAETITTELLAADAFWVSPARLPMPAEDRERVEGVLEEMVRAGLLIWHATGEEGRAYAFASHSVAQAAERRLGREAQRRHQARNEQIYIWRAWSAYDALAAKNQLQFLAEYGTADSYGPAEGLLLLRSAISRRLPLSTWYQRFDTAAARDLLRRLEMKKVPAGDEAEASNQTVRGQVSRLLGLNDGGLPPYPDSDRFGPVSWAAVAHPDWACRETSALALLAPFGEDVLPHLGEAAAAGEIGSWRMAGLRGLLAEVDPEIARENKEEPALQRAGIWWWRFRRRFVQDAGWIGSLTLGGALGVGLGLGLLRALLSFVVGEPAGINFSIYSYQGSLLGAALALGLALVNTVRLTAAEAGAGARPRPFLPAVALGGLAFALMQLLMIVLMVGLGAFGKWLVLLLALPAGAGVAAAVYDQPYVRRLPPLRWGGRLTAAAGGFLVAAGGFLLAQYLQFGRLACNDVPGAGTALNIGWSGIFFQSRFQDNLLRWGLDGLVATPGWCHLFSVIDAALVGIVLALGLALGLRAARVVYERWQKLVRAAGV